MSVASTTERPSGGSPLPFPSLSDCLLANVTNSREPDRAWRVVPSGRQPTRPSARTFGGRSAAKKQMTHSRRLAKELLTWPPTDPQNMLDPNTHPSVKSSPAGFPEPTCRGHAGGSAQPGPMGRNSHPDWSGLTFSMAFFLFLNQRYVFKCCFPARSGGATSLGALRLSSTTRRRLAAA